MLSVGLCLWGSRKVLRGLADQGLELRVLCLGPTGFRVLDEDFAALCKLRLEDLWLYMVLSGSVWLLIVGVCSSGILSRFYVGSSQSGFHKVSTT